jgi:serine/threonine-protein kinase
VTEQSDFYALGTIVYEMVAGRHPYDVELPSQELFAHQRLTPPPSFSELDPALEVPEALEAVVRRLLAKDPAERFGDADELIGALDDAMGEDRVYRAGLSPDSVRAPPPREPPQGELAARLSVGEGRRSPRRRLLVLAAISGLLVLGGFAARRRALSPTAPAIVSAPAPTALVVDVAPSGAPPVSNDEMLVEKKKRELVALTSSGDSEEAAAALLDLIGTDAGALAEEGVQSAVVTLLARLPSAAGSTDKVFYALTYNAGAAGFDALYGVFERFPSSYAARHAESTLTWLYDRASPALQVTWALRRTECGDVPRLFERAGNVGDKRTLSLLAAMQDPHCKLRRGQCCFRRNSALDKAVAQLKAL